MAKERQVRTGGSGKKKARIGQALLAIVVLAGMISGYVMWNQDSSSGTAQNTAKPDPLVESPVLRDRMILPAAPLKVRPITLDPNSFPEPEVKEAYQAAKDTPEPLEYMACYCGCFANAAHRNNLDCFKDQHGAT